MACRCDRAEQQLATVRDLEEEGDDATSVVSADSRNGLQQRRGNNNNKVFYAGGGKVVSDLERFGVKPNSGVSQAVTFIDTWALFTGRYVMHIPCYYALGGFTDRYV